MLSTADPLCDLVHSVCGTVDENRLALSAKILSSRISYAPFDELVAQKYVTLHKGAEKALRFSNVLKNYLKCAGSSMNALVFLIEYHQLTSLNSKSVPAFLLKVDRPIAKPEPVKPVEKTIEKPSKVYEPDSTEQELDKLLIKDLIYSFQAIDSQTIKKPVTKISEFIQQNLDKSITAGKYNLIKKLLTVGSLYSFVNDFCANAVESSSLVKQSFAAAIQSHLKEFHRLLAVLESNIETMTLRKLFVWMRDPLETLENLSKIIKTVAAHTGGQLLSCLDEFSKHGDPRVQELVGYLIEKSCEPFFQMVTSWIKNGTLNDPFNEFFVSMDPQVPSDLLWKHKFTFKGDQVPTFMDQSVARKIFVIGKSLHFMHLTCKETSDLPQSDSLMNEISNNLILTETVEKSYKLTCSYLMELLFKKYDLMSHLQALKRYMLLEQGDFCQCLMAELEPTLGDRAAQLYRHNLTASLEYAIRSSNAQFDKPETLKRLDVRLLEPSAMDSGWDVFVLDYHLDAPLSSVITPQAMQLYSKLFLFLWRLKRIEHVGSASWTLFNQGSVKDSKVFEQIHNSQLIWSEMMHFNRQLQYYIMFEIIESSWAEFQETISKGVGDLDLLISAHSKYLNSIVNKGVLSPAHDTLNIILCIIDSILTYKTIRERLFSFVDPEQEFKKPVSYSFEQVANQLLDCSSLFKNQLDKLLTSLDENGDPNLHGLAQRLNFNRFY